MENPSTLSHHFAPVKLDIRKGLAWDQRTDVILGLWLRSLFSKGVGRVGVETISQQKIQSSLSISSNFFLHTRHFQTPWGSRWWGLGTFIHHLEVCFLTLNLFGIFVWISIVIIVVRSRHLTVWSEGDSWICGDGCWGNNWTPLVSWWSSHVKWSYRILLTKVQEKTHIVWAAYHKNVRSRCDSSGKCPKLFCVIKTKHEIYKSKGMRWNGKLWWFLDVFFQVWTKLSSSGDTKTHKLPTTCTLSRLLPERSRSVTSHHSRNFTNCSVSQFLTSKDFSRNLRIVKPDSHRLPIQFPIAILGIFMGVV